MSAFDWREENKDRIGTAEAAIKLVRPGNRVFIGTGCGVPQSLVAALAAHPGPIADTQVLHMLGMGPAPYADETQRERFTANSFYITESVRKLIDRGVGDYTPIALSELPREFASGRIAIDVALIMVSPPDEHGLCSFGVAVDIVKTAAATAKYLIAQVNPRMPRTLGDSFIHVNSIDMLIPGEEPLIELPPEPQDDTLARIAANVARLIDDGSTIQIGLGGVPHAVARALVGKKDLGVHTEMVSDWIVDLVESGAVNGAKKSINRGKIVASMCMGTRRVYDFVNGNAAFEFHPADYVSDTHVIAQHDRMVSVGTAMEIDLTGQVCSDSLGYDFYSGVGGQSDFNRGASRSRGGKSIIALPSTARDHTVSRILPRLSDGAGVTIPRADVHYVVTEFGVADLRGKTIRERVLDLINIAHPRFRNELIQFAKTRKYLYADQIELAWEKVPYPQDLERYDTLRDGEQLLFRPVKPTDEAALSEMLYSLSPDSLRSRYLTHTITFPHRDIQRLTNVDYQRDIAIVGVIPSVAGEEIVAIGQYFTDPKTQAAEVAFIVQDEWQKRGMGTLLLKHLLRVAQQRGVKRFHAKVQPDNKAMLAIFNNSGYAVETAFDGTTYSVTCDLTKPVAG